MFVVAKRKAIKVSMAVAESPICGPNCAGLIQKTAQDMATMRHKRQDHLPDVVGGDAVGIDGEGEAGEVLAVDLQILASHAAPSHRQ